MMVIKNWYKCLFYLFLIIVFLFSNIFGVNASTRKVLSAQTTIGATVGSLYLNVSGYTSPYASINLTSDGISLRATVADQNGNFFLSQILISSGFSHFCLDVVDFKKIGHTQVCFNFPPATSNITFSNLVLPPTIALEGNQINYNAKATVLGYSVPFSVVTLHVSNGETFTTTADKTGYYEFDLANLAGGQYDLYVTTSYNGKTSPKPSTIKHLVALTAPQTIVKKVTSIIHKPMQVGQKLINQTPLGPLWFAIPLILLITAMVWKLLHNKFSILGSFGLFKILRMKRKHPLHHAWFVGY